MATPIRPSASFLRSILPSHTSRRHIRRFATSLQTLPTPAPYLPTYPDRAPSPIATSSAWTLDHPLWKIPASSPKRHNIVAALIFASDEDLASALIASPRRRGRKDEHGDEWAASIDAGLAFLALRSRPTYDLFLQNLRLSFRKVYSRLQLSNNHELLVSDILLRHPDPHLLREILEANEKLPERHQLRRDLQMTIFTRIGPALDLLPPLSRGVLVRLSKMMIKDGPKHLDNLMATFRGLKRFIDPNSAEEVWKLISPLLSLPRHHQTAAVAFLKELHADGVLPDEILLRSHRSHPSYVEIELYGTALRYALSHKLKVRAQDCTEKLLHIMETSELSLEGWECVMESVRTALAPKDMHDATWAKSMTARLCLQRDWPPIPSATIERALEGMLLKDRAAWYAGLLNGSYEPPSAAFLFFMTTTRPTPTLWRKIIADMKWIPPEESAHVQADFLCAMLHHQRGNRNIRTSRMFSFWGSTQLSFEDISKIVSTTIQLKKRRFGALVLRQWVQERPHLGEEHRTKLAEMFLQLNAMASAREQLLSVDPENPAVAKLLQKMSPSNSRTPESVEQQPVAVSSVVSVGH